MTTGIYIGEFSYRSDVAFILRNPMSLDVGGCQIKKASKKYRSFQKKKSAAGAKIILTRGNLKSVAYLKLMFISIPDSRKGKMLIGK